jgi:tetratricopeptide (TPR) repeat protein
MDLDGEQAGEGAARVIVAHFAHHHIIDAKDDEVVAHDDVAVTAGMLCRKCATSSSLRAGILATVRFMSGMNTDLPQGDLARWCEAPRRLLWFVQGAERGMAGDWKGAFEAMATGAPVLQGFSLAGLDAEILARSVKTSELPHLALGLLLHVQDLRSAAMNQYAAALAQHGESVLANFLQGAGRLAAADLKAAENHFVKSLTKAPRFFPALYALGDLCMRTRQAEPALEYFQKANEVVPTEGIDLRMGIIYENTNCFEQAETCYQRFVKACPEAFIGYNQLAWLYASRGSKLDEAMRLAVKADSLQPGNASVLDTIGWVHFQQGRPAQALETLLASIRINPANPTVCYHLGAVYAAQGNQPKAREFLRQALDLSREFPELKEAELLLGKL